MPRIRMKRNFNFHRTKHSLIALKAGNEYRVTTPCAEAAIAAGAAEYTEFEKRRRRRVDEVQITDPLNVFSVRPEDAGR